QRRGHRRRVPPHARSPKPATRRRQEDLTNPRGEDIYLATSGDRNLAVDRWWASGRLEHLPPARVLRHEVGSTGWAGESTTRTSVRPSSAEGEPQPHQEIARGLRRTPSRPSAPRRARSALCLATPYRYY